MFAEIISFKLKPATAYEMQKLTEQKIVPWLRGQIGFHGMHLVQVSDTEMIAFNVWNSRVHAETSKVEEQRLIQQAIGHILTSPPSFGGGRIVVHAPGHGIRHDAVIPTGE